MIVISKKILKSLRPLAHTISGREHAYFASFSDVRELGLIPERVAFSRYGEEWMPDISGERLTIFIAGNPGAGKSFLSKDLINLFPQNTDVLLFTALEEEDGNFRNSEHPVHKIRMEPENLSRITLSAIRERSHNPVLLFDDVDKIRAGAVEKATYKILEDALANGRGHRKHDGRGDIHVIATSHALNDYKKTKYTLENSNYIALFPQSTTYAQMERLFTKLGLSKDLCREMYDKGAYEDVRRIIIHKTTPMYIISGSEIRLI